MDSNLSVLRLIIDSGSDDKLLPVKRRYWSVLRLIIDPEVMLNYYFLNIGIGVP